MEHEIEGSPVKPSTQWHVLWWEITRQIAFEPHDPVHGSLHRMFKHAKFDGHW